MTTEKTPSPAPTLSPAAAALAAFKARKPELVAAEEAYNDEVRKSQQLLATALPVYAALFAIDGPLKDFALDVCAEFAVDAAYALIEAVDTRSEVRVEKARQAYVDLKAKLEQPK
jgi:hypothetical protein